VTRILLAFALLAVATSGAQGAQLLMFEEVGCEWCERWHDEVGGIYGATDEGRKAPLRQLRLGQSPDGVGLKRPVTYSPTFVLVHKDREVGRITGYPGADFFWGYLAQLLAKLPGEQQTYLLSGAKSGRASGLSQQQTDRPTERALNVK